MGSPGGRNWAIGEYDALSWLVAGQDFEPEISRR